MRILFLVPEPFFQLRGSSIHIKNFLEALAEAGHKIDFLSFAGGELPAMDGVTFHRVPAKFLPRRSSVRTGLGRALLNSKFFIRAVAMCLRGEYDAIHAVGEASSFVHRLHRMFGCDLVYQVGELAADRTPESMMARLFARSSEVAEARTIRRAKVVITPCASLSDRVRAMEPGVEVAQIEPAPLDASFQDNEDGAAALREEYGLDACRLVVYTGGFEPWQGLELLMRAVPDVLRRCDDVRFVIVGGSPQEVDGMAGLAQALDVAAGCVLAGRQPLERISAFMTAAAVLVSPRTRGQHAVTKLSTYMQSGKPIVATKLPCHTQMLDDTCAILVLAQADTLANGIVQALREPLLSAALGKEARARVAEKYSLASFKHKVRKAYQAVGS